MNYILKEESLEMVENDGYQNLKKAVLDCYRTFWSLISKAKFHSNDTSLLELQKQAMLIRSAPFNGTITEEEKIEKSANLVVVSSNGKTQYLALLDFIQHMDKVYEKCESKVKSQIEHEQSTTKNPKELYEKIVKLQTELTEIDDQMHGALEQMTREYMDNGGKLEKEADGILQKYREEIEKINWKDKSSLERLEKLSLRQVDIFRDYQSRFQDELMKDCDTILGIKLNEFALPAEFMMLDFEKSKESIRNCKNEVDKTSPLSYDAVAGKVVGGSSSLLKLFFNDDGGPFSLLKLLSVNDDGGFVPDYQRKIDYLKQKEIYYQKYRDECYKLSKKCIMEIIEKIKEDVITRIRLVAKNIFTLYKKEVKEDIESKKMECLLLEKNQKSNIKMLQLIQEKKQFIMQIERNRDDLLDYQTMINEALKLVRTTQVE